MFTGRYAKRINKVTILIFSLLIVGFYFCALTVNIAGAQSSREDSLNAGNGSGSFFPTQPSASNSGREDSLNAGDGSGSVAGDVQNGSLPQGSTVSADGVNSSNSTQDKGQGLGLSELMALIWNTLAGILYIFFVALPVKVAALAGMLFNASIKYFILEMGSLINVQTGIGFAINNLWTVVRDTMNILFIFGLVYIGIKTILNSEDSGTRRLLGLLIAAALLINFSLFISKAVIDFTNVMAIEINNLVGVDPQSGGGNSGLITYSGISGAFFYATGAINLVAQVQITEITNNSADTWEAVVAMASYMFMILIFFIVLTVVFVAGAFMLFSRFIALIIYMIFSPVMFLGWILPSFNKYSIGWWDGFFKKAFFAPLFMFMLYISLIATEQLRSGIGASTADYGSAIDADAGAFGIIMVFIFAIGMLVASIIVAQKMSIVGAGATMGVLKGAKNQVQSFVGRNTVGRGSNFISKQYDRFQSSKLGSSFAGRMGRGVLNTATLGATSDRSVRRTFEAGKTASFGGTSFSAIEKEEKERKAKLALKGKKSDLKTIISTYDSDSSTENQIAMERAVGDASQKQLEELGADTLAKTSVSGALSQSQFDGIMKSEEFNDNQKSKIATSRSASVKSKLLEKADNPDSRVKVEDASTSQLTALGGEYLSSPEKAVWLNEKQMDELEKKMTDGEFLRIKNSRKDALINVAKGDDIGGFTMENIFNKKPAEMAKLPKEVLTNKNIVKNIPVSTLAKIATDGTQNKEVQAAIRKAILEETDDNYEIVEGYGSIPSTPNSDQAKWLTEIPLGKQFGV